LRAGGGFFLALAASVAAAIGPMAEPQRRRNALLLFSEKRPRNFQNAIGYRQIPKGLLILSLSKEKLPLRVRRTSGG
jgi:hypothetical protein